MTNVSTYNLESKGGSYIPELNENINYGDRSPKGGSSCQPLCLLEKRLEATPSCSKILLYRCILVEIVAYGRELIYFIVKHKL
jgi:hypothetical protein